MKVLLCSISVWVWLQIDKHIQVRSIFKIWCLSLFDVWWNGVRPINTFVFSTQNSGKRKINIFLSLSSIFWKMYLPLHCEMQHFDSLGVYYVVLKSWGWSNTIKANMVLTGGQWVFQLFSLKSCQMQACHNPCPTTLSPVCHLPLQTIPSHQVRFWYCFNFLPY